MLVEWMGGGSAQQEPGPGLLYSLGMNTITARPVRVQLVRVDTR